MTGPNQLHKYIQSIDTEWYRHRFIVCICLVLTAFAFLGIRLIHLQIVRGEYYHELSKDNCIRKKHIPAFRGLIYDRHGHLLVENRPSFNLRITPKDADPLEQTVQRLCGYVAMTPSAVMEKIHKDSAGPYDSILIRDDIDRNTMAAIAAHRFELPGVSIEARARRHYLYPTMGAHLLGYMGELNPEEVRGKKFRDKQTGDYVGRFGAEKVFEDALSGRSGGRIIQVNAGGQIVAVLDEVPPAPGDNLFLTIDFALQKKAESLLEGRVGAVVAMDPGSGEILAMSSTPSFNPNHFVDGMSAKQWSALTSDPDRPMMNKAIQAAYPPASTYKMVTAMAALEEGVTGPDEETYCPGHYRYGNRLYYCWKKYGHGHMNVTAALKQSCDVYFYHMGRRLGVDKMAEYAIAGGLGSPTGIVLDREDDGLVPTAEWKQRRFGVPWQGGENLSIAIGQGYNLTTPIQMAVLTSAVANGGFRYQPRILKRIETVEGKIVKKGGPVLKGRLPVSDTTLALVRKGLWQVVNERHGTAYWHVRDKTIEISGKTGTAQIVSRKRGDPRAETYEDRFKPHAWFVGYAPSKAPRIAVSVLIEHGEHGSSGAGPIAGELMKSYLDPSKSLKNEE